MKFVALALALFLAVGSQAASLQADAPSQLAHIRSTMDVYANHLKESAKRALDRLDGTDYAELKVSISQRLDNFHDQLKALQQSVSPMTDSFVQTIMDATSDARSTISQDITSLSTQTEAMRDTLKTKLDEHFAQYRELLEPIMKEYRERHTAEMDALKVKLEPVMVDLRAKVDKNLGETKEALEPIVEAVRNKITERLDTLKTAVSPYVEEYKEQAKQLYSQGGNINTDKLEKLRETIAPLAVDVKVKLQAIFEAIAATFTQN